jgi:pimeloyl-ACP methyl ester carboxylesterase
MLILSAALFGVAEGARSYAFNDNGKILEDAGKFRENPGRHLAAVTSDDSGKKAIYVLPGYMGSKLYQGNAEKWFDSSAMIAEISAWYVSAIFGGNSSLFTQDEEGAGIKVDALFGKDEYGTFDSYESLIDKLQEEFDEDYGGNGEYEVIFYPFNWLGDLNNSASLLEENINSGGYERVVFVTHSTGGLLASAYIAKPENRSKVEKAVLIAAPLFGTYMGLMPIEFGETPGLNDLLLSLFNPYEIQTLEIPIVHRWVKAVTKNSPTTYQLFPSLEYLKLHPLRYEENTPEGKEYETVSSVERYYSVLDESENINSQLTAGNIRSHFHLRNNVFGSEPNSIVKLWEEVNTTLIGNEYGFITPYTPVYEKESGNTKIKDMLFNMNGDGTVLYSSSAAAANPQNHQLDYVNFENLSHSELVRDSSVLNRVGELIKGVSASRAVSAQEEAPADGMSGHLKLHIEADKPVNILIYNGSTAAARVEDMVLAVFNESDRKNFSYTSLTVSEDITNAILYLPNASCRVVFYGDAADESVDFTVDVTTLDYDGFNTGMATYNADKTSAVGEILTLDATSTVTGDNIGSLAAGLPVNPVLFYNQWELESEKTLAGIGATGVIQIFGPDAETGSVNASDLAWSSSDPGIVSVSDTGEISAIGQGEAVIFAAARNASYKFSRSVVTVTGGGNDDDGSGSGSGGCYSGAAGTVALALFLLAHALVGKKRQKSRHEISAWLGAIALLLKF